MSGSSTHVRPSVEKRGPVAFGARADLAPGRARLRRAVAVVQHRVRERVRELGLHRRAQHRAAVAEPDDLRAVPPVGLGERGLRERARHRVADDPDRRRVLGDREVEHARRVEVAIGVDDRAVAAEERDQREPLPAAVHQRSEHERAHPERGLGVAGDLGRLARSGRTASRPCSTRRRSPRDATSRPWACRSCRPCRACRRRRPSGARRRSRAPGSRRPTSPMRIAALEAELVEDRQVLVLDDHRDELRVVDHVAAARRRRSAS